MITQAERAFEVESSQILLWVLKSDDPSIDLSALEKNLDLSEKERLNRLPAQEKRNFIVSRGALRAILGRIFDISPVDVTFVIGESGKPALAPGFAREIKFNVSHCQGLVLLGFRRSFELGVDAEFIHRKVDIEALSKRFFSEPERTYILGSEGSERISRFFRVWTRKEALVKATGQGIANAFQRFDVSGEHSEIEWPLGSQHLWTLKDIELPGGYAGAVATEGTASVSIMHHLAEG